MAFRRKSCRVFAFVINNIFRWLITLVLLQMKCAMPINNCYTMLITTDININIDAHKQERFQLRYQ